MLLHPLRGDEFWKRYFSQKALLLRRGANHKVILTSPEAAGLIRGARLGEDAEITGPNLWNRDPNRRPTYSPEQGLPAVAALARGKPIRLLHIERKSPRLFARDPLLNALSRLAPGRGIA